MRVVGPTVVWFIFAVTHFAFAQAAEPEIAHREKLAITDSKQADVDFTLQGEYLTDLIGPYGRCPQMGLQVIALGDGRFEAVAFEGGLPGAGWDRSSKFKLAGERTNGNLILQGNNLVAAIESNVCRLKSIQGRTLAQLNKVCRVSPTRDLPPPPGAIVLFGDSSLEQLEGAHLTDDGYLSTGVSTRMPVVDFRLHLEFRTPYMPYARGQGRGNSGIYIQQRYELQILDSFGLEGIENECGAIYKQRRPLINICLPPLVWQTYDIFFTAARWDGASSKIANAKITAFLNGVPIHHHQEISAKTGAGKEEAPDPMPILLQHHNNPVAFRNIWLVPGSPAYDFDGELLAAMSRPQRSTSETDHQSRRSAPVRSVLRWRRAY